MIKYEDAKKLAVETLKTFKIKPTVVKENEYVYVFTIKDDANIGGPIPLVIDKETGDLMNMTECIIDGHNKNLYEREL